MDRSYLGIRRDDRRLFFVHVSARKKARLHVASFYMVDILCHEHDSSYVPLVPARPSRSGPDLLGSQIALRKTLPRVLLSPNFDSGVFMKRPSACFRNRQIPMQAAGVMSERHSDRKTAKVGGIIHHEKSASVTEFRTSFGHFVFLKRACLTDMRAFMLTWAGLLQDLKTLKVGQVSSRTVTLSQFRVYAAAITRYISSGSWGLIFPLACLKLEHVTGRCT
jgi:hypothetical protein